VPGDDIIGFVTRGQGVSVHRRDCRNVEDLLTTPDRIVPVHWTESFQATFAVSIHIEGLDRMGLLADITTTIAEDKVPILSATLQTGKNRTFRATLSVEIPDPKYLDRVLGRIRGIRDVTEVHRLSA
jgi:GTP pyrophosphokinase